MMRRLRPSGVWSTCLLWQPQVAAAQFGALRACCVSSTGGSGSSDARGSTSRTSNGGSLRHRFGLQAPACWPQQQQQHKQPLRLQQLYHVVTQQHGSTQPGSQQGGHRSRRHHHQQQQQQPGQPSDHRVAHPAQQQLSRAAFVLHSSSSSSSSSDGGSSVAGAAEVGGGPPSAAAAAVLDVGEDQGGDGDDSSSSSSSSCELSSFDQQYQQTLESLHSLGHSKNLSHLARLFDPAAVLAAPDKGAAILQALMLGAAQLGDLQLLRELLQCMSAAQLPLSASGHTAVLHGLAKAGRPAQALAWLQQQLPEQLLNSQMVRRLVQPLLAQGRVQEAEQAVEWATAKLRAALAAAEAAPAAAGVPVGSSAVVSAAGSGFRDDHQVIPCMRLMVAAAKNSLRAVQQEWAHLQQQQQQQQAWNVAVLSSYVSALGRVSRPGEAGARDARVITAAMQQAVAQMCDVYHATAWSRWQQLQQQRQQRLQQQHGTAAAPETAAAAAERAAAASRQRWQQLQQQLPRLSWQQLDAAAVLPQEVAACVQPLDRKLLRRAFDSAMKAAAARQDGAWQALLLKQLQLVKAPLGRFGYDFVFKLRLDSGATPEELEELLSEMIGFGVAPSLALYEHILEAHALHRDLAAAEQVLDRIQGVGLMPVLRTYNRLLHGISLNGDMAAATRVYSRLKAQGMAPDQQTMRALFKCVRMYAMNVRVTVARQLAQCKPGDREAMASLLSHRAGLFAGAYSQLAAWQGELVAAGLKHRGASLHNLLAALERLGATADCLQLAKLHDQMSPGDFTAHRFALQSAARQRNVEAAGLAASLAEQVAAGDALSAHDYQVLIGSQFWLNQDHGQLLDTVAKMRAAGHDLQQGLLLQLLHVYCHNNMWGEALQLLDDVARGRVPITDSLLGADDAAGEDVSVTGPAAAGPGWQDGSGSARPARRRGRKGAAAADDAEARGQRLVQSDALWHIVMRKLWEQRAGDGLLNSFLGRMSGQQLQRFKLLYNLQPLPDGSFTMQPPEDWQVIRPATQEQQAEGGRQQDGALDGTLDGKPVFSAAAM